MNTLCAVALIVGTLGTETPVQPRVEETRISLKVPTVVFMTAAAADWATTYRVGSAGVESNPLLHWTEPNQELLITVAVATDLAGLYAWNRLVGRKHPKIAAVGLYAMSGMRFWLAYRNYKLCRTVSCR